MQIVYDTGALMAAERRDRRVWTLHSRLSAREEVPVVPSVVLAQAWRGGPQAELSRFLAGCRLEPVTVAQGRAAGTACAAAQISDVVDALVVVRAIDLDAVIVTSDPQDLRHIADSLGRRLDIVAV